MLLVRISYAASAARSSYLFGEVGEVDLVGRVVAAISGLLASTSS
jgi:hypothetical protein